MTIHENLTVSHHQQDTSYYCGAACAQMVLQSIGAGVVDQDDLYTDARNHTSELASWYNPPDGLQWVMNDRRPAGFGGWFALYALSTEDAISRKIVWTIHHYQVAPIALVYSGDHWIVVRGYEASAAPTGSTDTSFTITAFEVNNPWPPVPGSSPPPPPPPPHSVGDGCGTGGNRGVANEHVAYATWQSSYMTGNVYGTAWNAKNVAICDPDPPPEHPGRVAPQVKRLSGEQLISPKEAVDLATAGIRQYGLHQKKGWREAFKNRKPLTPMLVQRLDRTDSFYYIVPFEGRNKAAVSAVSVDARFGDYRQSIAVPEGGSGLIVAEEANVVLKRLIGRRLDLEEPLGRLRVRKEALCLYPMLVWRPCRESLSPYYPFHMLTVGDLRIYVRIDGHVFTKLHIDIPGI